MADIDAMLRELESQPSYKEASDAENARKLLEELEASGNIRPGEAEALANLRAEQPANEQQIGATEASYRGALQGATFQQADELYGLFGGDKEAARLKNLEAQAAFPTEYKTGKTAGALGAGALSAAATGPLGAGRTLLGTMARGGGLGALEGAIWGAGGAEGYGDKAKEALRYGLVGGGIGAAAPAVVAGGSALARGAGDIVGGMLNIGNKPRAQRNIIQALMRGGNTVDSVADDVARAAQQGQPEYRLMDAMGRPGARLASGVARAGGDGSDDIARFLERRQLGQPERVAAFTDEAFGMNGQTAEQVADMIDQTRGGAAKITYGLARDKAGFVNLNNTLDEIDSLVKRNPILGDSDLATGPIGSKLKSLSARMRNNKTGSQLIDFDDVLNIKEDMGTMIANLKKSNKKIPPEFAKVYRQLDEALEASSTAYRLANDSFRETSGVLDAVDKGAKLTNPQRRSEDTIREFLGMTPDEQAAARIGYGDKRIARIAGSDSPTANRAKPFNSPKVSAEVDEMAIDPRLLKDRLARENAMWETQNRALQGSRTADNLADQQNTSALADAIRAGRDAATMNFGQMTQNAAQAAGRFAGGQNEGTRAALAQLLMSNNPREALARGLRSAKTSQARRRIIEGLMRAFERDQYTPSDVVRMLGVQ